MIQMLADFIARSSSSVITPGKNMPTYVYETVKKPHRRFEIKQSMKDPALAVHPETGEPVRRVISGGYGLLQKGGGTGGIREMGGGCGPGCGCH